MIRDDGDRTLLFDLDSAIQSLAKEGPGNSVGVQAHGRLSQPAASLGRDVERRRLCISPQKWE